jgi:ribosomal protein S21
MATNLTIRVRRGEHPERAIRRFTKKVKKMKILERYRETLRFEKPSDKNRRERNRRIKENKTKTDKY